VPHYGPSSRSTPASLAARERSLRTCREREPTIRFPGCGGSHCQKRRLAIAPCGATLNAGRCRWRRRGVLLVLPLFRSRASARSVVSAQVPHAGRSHDRNCRRAVRTWVGGRHETPPPKGPPRIRAVARMRTEGWAGCPAIGSPRRQAPRPRHGSLGFTGYGISGPVHGSSAMKIDSFSLVLTSDARSAAPTGPALAEAVSKEGDSKPDRRERRRTNARRS
jgi:hypothetical protein